MKIKDIELWQGDCLELMKNIPDGSVDLVLADPPYGIDYQSARRKDKAKRIPKILGDKETSTEFVPDIKRIIKPTGAALIFTRWDVQAGVIEAMNSNGLKVRSVLVWDKMAHSMGDLKRAYSSCYESILFHSQKDFRFPHGRPQDIIAVRRVPPNRLSHPNEKPTALLERLIEQTTRGGALVVDFCMGSGSTGVACVNTGRRFIGIELDEHYFKVATERIEKAKEALP